MRISDWSSDVCSSDLLPYDPHVGISQKIESEEDRIALRERVLQFRGDDKGGFIVRTQAEGATDEELQGDHTYLRTLWRSEECRVGKEDGGTCGTSWSLCH